MKELAIVVSDIHIHKYRQFNQNNRRLTNGISLLDYVFKLAAANQLKYIIIPGDLYNSMQLISTEVVDAVIECLTRNFIDNPQIRVLAISGNHDQAGKNLIDMPAVSALRHLSVVFKDNFTLLDNDVFETEAGNKLLGIPYYEYPEHFRKTLEGWSTRFNWEDKTILLMHQVVASGLPIEDHILPDDPLFTPFKMIFNGHIHKGQEVTDTFINIGSPMHRDAGDIGVRKGIWIVDLCDPLNTLSFRDITDKFPQYIHKGVGDPVNEWEQQQYIIQVPQIVENEKVAEISSKFNTSLAPAILMENYCKEVLAPDVAKENLKYGLQLLS